MTVQGWYPFPWVHHLLAEPQLGATSSKPRPRERAPGGCSPLSPEPPSPAF